MMWNLQLSNKFWMKERDFFSGGGRSTTYSDHLTAANRNRINVISRKALRRGVTHTAFDIAEIINKFDCKLFSRIIHPGHCLYHLLPTKTPGRCRYSLRERQHSFQLSNIEFLQFKNSFINRCLFKFRWLYSALQSDVFSEFCAYCSYCSCNFRPTFYFV